LHATNKELSDYQNSVHKSVRAEKEWKKSQDDSKQSNEEVVKSIENAKGA
jgi:hypothetical protein